MAVANIPALALAVIWHENCGDPQDSNTDWYTLLEELDGDSDAAEAAICAAHIDWASRERTATPAITSATCCHAEGEI